MSDYSDYQVISPAEDPSGSKWTPYYLSPTKQKVHIQQSVDQKASGSDIDYYKFTASSDKTITLTFDDTGKTFGVLSLASDNQPGPHHIGLLTYGEHGSKQQAEQYNYKYSFSYNVKAGQTYYIGVNSVQTYNSFHNSGLGSYSIYVDFNGAIDTTATAPQPSSSVQSGLDIVDIDSNNPPNGESDPGGFLKENAFDLQPYYINGVTDGFALKGTLSNNDKYDTYVFSVEKDMKANIVLSALNKGKTLVNLFKDDIWPFSVVAAGTSDANGDVELGDVELKAGAKYYLATTPKDLSSAFVQYDLKINFDGNLGTNKVVFIDSDNPPNGESEPGNPEMFDWGAEFDLKPYYKAQDTTGYKIIGTLSGYTDQWDAYKFSVDSSMKVNILFDFDFGSSDHDQKNISIFLHKGGITHSVEPAKKNAYGYYEIKDITLDANTDYGLAINNHNGYSNVKYTAKINFLETAKSLSEKPIVEIDSDNPPNGEAEPEGMRSGAFDLRPYYTNGKTEGYKITGTFDKSDNRDTYKFSVDKNMRVNIMFDGGFTVDDIITISPWLFEDHIFGDGAVGTQDASGRYLIKDFALEKGHVYYIALENTRKLDNINYTLTIDFAEPEPIMEIDSDNPPNGEPEPGSGHDAHRAFYLDNYYVKGKTEGYKIKGTLDATDTLDKYRFSVDKDMKASILFDSVGGDTVTVKLHEVSGDSTDLVATATRNANGDYEIKNTQLKANVDYVVEIHNDGKGEVTYDLNINFGEQKIVKIDSDYSEPGETTATAFDLESYYTKGTTEKIEITGTMSADDRNDYYRLSFKTDTRAKIELTNINRGGDIDLAMYDANINTLFYEWKWGNADLHIDAYDFKAGEVYYVRTYDYLGVDSSYTLLVDIL